MSLVLRDAFQLILFGYLIFLELSFIIIYILYGNNFIIDMFLRMFIIGNIIVILIWGSYIVLKFWR